MYVSLGFIRLSRRLSSVSDMPMQYLLKPCGNIRSSFSIFSTGEWERLSRLSSMMTISSNVVLLPVSKLWNCRLVSMVSRSVLAWLTSVRRWKWFRMTGRSVPTGYLRCWLMNSILSGSVMLMSFTSILFFLVRPRLFLVLISMNCKDELT